MMPGTLSLSSTATNGRVATLRFAKTALPAIPALVDAVASEVAVASAEVLALVEASVVVVAASAAAMEDVVDLEEASEVPVDRPEVASNPTVLPTHRTPSPTSLHLAASQAT